MKSEKVKEIKEQLQEEILIATSFDDKLRRVETKFLQDILTLINELEEENEHLNKINNEKRFKDLAEVKEIMENNKKLKDRIAELEKENAIKTDTIVDLLKKQEFYEKEKLTNFAERLKERLKDNVNGDNVDYYVECAIYIDETLKDFINQDKNYTEVK